MKAWADRPLEVANLLNPAYCGLILRNFVAGYRKEGAADVDAALLFIAMPLALHRDTRISLPSTVATKFHSWLEENQTLKIGFAQRCKSLAPYTREALIFACTHGLMTATDLGGVTVDSVKKIADPNFSDETTRCLDAGYFLGRWLKMAGPPERVFSMWGVRP